MLNYSKSPFVGKKIISFFFLLFLFVASCKDKEPTAPEDVTPAATLAEKTIGPEGGTLSTDEFILTIPEGALKDNTQLKLLSSSESDPFQEYSRSDLYRIEGIPEDYTKPLKISIKYTNTLENESYIVVGEEGMNASDGSEDIIYDFLGTVDSSGFIIGSLPVENDSASSLGLMKYANNVKWKTVKVISNFFRSSGGYEIYYPNTGVNPGLEIVSFLDNAFKICADTLRLTPRVYIPKIYVGNLGAEKYCTFRWRNPTDKRKEKGVIAINSNKMSDLETLRIMIGREVLRLLLFGYDPQFPIMVGPSQQNYHWLNEAVISWAEQFFVPPNEKNNHVPTSFSGKELAPFNGLHAGKNLGGADAITNATNHGSGISSFIKFLFTNQENRDIKDIYVGIKNGEHPVKCIDELIKAWNFTQKLSTKWGDYFREYIKGNIYSVDQSIFINSIQTENTFTINDKEDTVKTFKLNYSDLSAKMFRVNFDYKEIDPKAELYIEIKPEILTGDAKYAFMYLLKSSKLTEMGKLYTSYIVPNIKDYVDNDKDLCFLVVNGNYKEPSYTNTTEIELKLKVRTAQFNRCKIDLIFVGEYSYLFQGNDFRTTQLTWDGPISYYESDSVYAGTWNEDRDGNKYVGELAVKIDPETKNIKYFVATNTRTDNYGDKYEYDVVSKKVDLAVNNDGYFRDYKVFGTSVCSYIQELDYIGGDQYTGFTLVKHSCQGDSYLNIHLYSKE